MQSTHRKLFVAILLVLYVPFFLWIVGAILYALTENNVITNEGLHAFLVQINNSFGTSDPPIWVQYILLFVFIGMLIAVVTTTISLHRWIRDITKKAAERADAEQKIIDKEPVRHTASYSIGSTGTIYRDEGTLDPRINWYRVKEVILWVLIAVFAIFLFPFDAIRWLIVQRNNPNA